MEAYLQTKFADSASPTTLMRRIRFLVGISDGATDISFLNDTNRIFGILNKYTNVSTRWTHSMHIVMALRLDPDLITDATRAAYDRYLGPLRDAAIGHITNNVMTENESKLLDTTLAAEQDRLRKAILAHFAKYELEYKLLTKAALKKIDLVKFAHDFQELVYLGAYLFQPALRSNYGTMRITTKSTRLDESHNYLYKRGSTMALLMRNYKNSKSMGYVRIPARAEFKQLIDIWLSLLKIINPKPVGLMHYKITNTEIRWLDSDAAVTNNIRAIANKWLGRAFTINAFRKLWETSIQTDPTYQNLTVREKTEIHKEMLHTRTTAELYHRKSA
jgi:hypothetical protein